MKSFLSVSLICFLLAVSSCAPGIRNGCRKDGRAVVGKAELPPMISLSDTLQKYHMEVSFGKRSFSGILLVRQKEETARILYTTHFGMTLFDLEMNGQSYVIKQCIPPLHKKKLFNLLYSDFSLLFGLHLNEKNNAITYHCGDNPEAVVYKLQTPRAKGYYRKQLLSNRIERISVGSAFGKATFNLNQTVKAGADSVSIAHPLLKIHLQMTAF